jgi:CRISPR-associated protein Cas1
MRILLLNGYNANMHVDGAKLFVRDGVTDLNTKPEEYIFSPKKIDVDHIVVYGRNGNISIDAIRWLIKHNVQISILNWDGKLLTTMLPPESVQVKTKFHQYDAYKDSIKRTHIARKLLEAKFSRTQLVLDWLKERYHALKNDFSSEAPLFRKAKSIPEMMMVEGRIASIYWQEFAKIVPEKFEFDSRKYQKRPWGAGDTVNCLLNYAYALLEAECLKAINSSGLDVHIGFLHEMNIGKNSLAYDLQEPFRFLIDLAVINLIENNVMEKKDFIRTDNYNLRLKASGAKKVTEEVNKWFNKKTEYLGYQYSMSYIILLKSRELAQYLSGKKSEINFSIPEIKINRQDAEDVRQKIRDIKYSDWKKLGFSKGTLHYMKQNADADKPFTMNKHVRDRLAEWDELAVEIKID